MHEVSQSINFADNLESCHTEGQRQRIALNSRYVIKDMKS